VERHADVDFQVLELPDEGGLVDPEVLGSGVDGGNVHHRAEAVKPLPAMKSALDARRMSRCSVTASLVTI